jgi:hypothetical protein
MGVASTFMKGFIRGPPVSGAEPRGGPERRWLPQSCFCGLCRIGALAGVRRRPIPLSWRVASPVRIPDGATGVLPALQLQPLSEAVSTKLACRIAGGPHAIWSVVCIRRGNAE